MTLLAIPVFLILAVASLLTDNPLDQRLIGAWLFLSLGVLIGGGTRLAVSVFLHRTAAQPRVRKQPSWFAPAMVVWAASWLLIAAYVAVTGRGVPGSRWLAVVLAAAFGLALLYAVRTRLVRQ